MLLQGQNYSLLSMLQVLITKYGLYEHCTIPMDLRNLSATFQRCVKAIVHGINWVSCLVYLDDIIVIADTFQEHADRVDMVLSQLKSSGLRLKASKCSIFSETAHFLGHILTSQGVLPSPSNVARIKIFAAPEKSNTSSCCGRYGKLLEAPYKRLFGHDETNY